VLLNQRRGAQFGEYPASENVHCHSSSPLPLAFPVPLHVHIVGRDSSTESREHLGQGIDLALLHLFNTLAVIFAIVGANTAEICRTC